MERPLRFEIGELIGEGSYARVYRAWDTMLECEVALKVLRPKALATGGARARVIDEARLVARLCRPTTHPGIVTLFDVLSRSSQVMLVMELMPGGTLESLLAREKLPTQEISRIGREVAAALAHAHDHGVIHRDIKPSNLLLASDGRVKVSDFGLARLVPELPMLDGIGPAGAERSVSGLIGTPAYMSPEQVRGISADARSDIFSLSVTLFEAATGERPFKGDNLFDIGRSILHDEPAWVRDGVPRVDPGLAAVLARGLAKEAADRYQNMLMLARDLERVRSVPYEPAEAIAPVSSIVGRQAHLEALRERLDQAAAPGGRGHTFVISGEAGIGKTTLVDEFARMAVLARSAAWSRETFREDRRGPSVIADALTALPCQRTDVDVVGPVSDHGAADPVGETAVKRPGPSSRQALVDALRTIRMPFVLILEDVQAAGADSLEALRALVSVMPATNGLLVLTYRSDVPLAGEGERLRRFLQWMRDGSLASEMVLPRFGKEDTAKLLSRLLDATPAPDAVLVTYVQEQSEGNPLFIREGVHLLQRDHHLTRSGLLEPGLGPMPVPDKIRRILSRRIEILAAPLRLVLQAAAVEGEVFHVDTIAQVGNLTDSESRRALSQLADEHQLIVASDGGYRFGHARIRDVVLETTPALERAALHGRIGTYLGQARPGEAARIARHLIAAGHRSRAVPHLLRAGRAAIRQEAFVEARGLYREALETLDGTHRTRPDQIKLMMELGRLERMTGEYRDARATFQHVARLAIGRDRLRGEAIHDLGWVTLLSGDLVDAVRQFRRALGCFLRVGDRGWVAACNDGLGVTHRHAGRLAEAERRCRAGLGLRRRLRFGWGVALSQSNLGTVYYTQGRYRRALACFEASYRLLKRHPKRGDAREKEATALHNIGLAAHHIGQHTRALAALREALAIRGTIGARPKEVRSQISLASVHAVLGLRQAAREAYERGARVAASLSGRADRAEALCGLGRLELQEGDVERALTRLQEAFAEASRAGDAEAIGAVASELAAGQIAAHRLREAEQTLLVLRAQSRKEGLGVRVARVEHLAGRLAEARGERRRAVAAYRRALGIPRDRVEPELAWRVHRDLARLLAVSEATRSAGRRHLASARRIVRGVAGGIEDDLLKRAYLGDPERAALLAEAAVSEPSNQRVTAS